MLQALLKDRFGLRFHMDSKEIPAYALVIGKSGSKLTETQRFGSISSGNGRTQAKGISAQDIASHLSDHVSRVVVDRTGLTGFYDFKLEWSPNENMDGALSIFTAVQEQLGLKLQPERLPVTILTIDSAERFPTVN